MKEKILESWLDLRINTYQSAANQENYNDSEGHVILIQEPLDALQADWNEDESFDDDEDVEGDLHCPSTLSNFVVLQSWTRIHYSQL